ncbi:hypothetical protein QWJ07_23505 [Frankia sp. RB7]|nr:hypothetical protein [Frankia sp. RB7]
MVQFTTETTLIAGLAKAHVEKLLALAKPKLLRWTSSAFCQL